MTTKQEPCKTALEKQIRIAQSLKDTLSVLNSNLELIQVLEFIVNQAKEILEADAASIYTLAESKKQLMIEASQGLTEDYIEDAIIPFGLGVTGFASFTGEIVAVQDVLKEETYKHLKFDKNTRKLIQTFRRYFRGLIAIPLFFSNGEIYGTLDLYYKKPNAFSEDEISLAKAYANQTILAIENTRLRANAKRSAALAERNRLARDLHDTVTQTLFSISLISGVLPDLWQRDPSAGNIALNELHQLSRGALAEMRTLLFELKPKSLVNEDLETLIQQLVDAFSAHTRIPVNYTFQPINAALPENVKIAFYRIVQETLKNIEKHGHASFVKIRLNTFHNASIYKRKSKEFEIKDIHISILIEDDGVGFFPGNLPENHYGIRIMHERANEIGAALTIESEPGGGTKIQLTW